MHLIRFNVIWMVFNIFLASIPVFAGWLMYLTKNKFLKALYALLWIVFLPNSVYLITDLINLFWQWNRVDAFVKTIFILQYAVLTVIGVFSFVLALYPGELLLRKNKNLKKYYPNIIIVILNFVIGFGITLGRVERVNSWDLVYAPMNVVWASVNIITSVELIILTIFFGIVGNGVFFLFKKPVLKLFNTYLAQAGVLP
jgi:uncharacterized membrane protein